MVHGAGTFVGRGRTGGGMGGDRGREGEEERVEKRMPNNMF
jgi:hypothetical protein